ncbi:MULTISPECIES: hypothetical protein [unclassified Coleofasciculus]|nr:MULTISPECIES: hypothetical protein [unclassified Coleofasciculus]MBE9128897.1 hypothetical protein [Coleofasciculus sp. LEGE 07081]MBE9151662.1 hypothetical protein [Coleofasciculus sp. LEGE 07092]
MTLLQTDEFAFGGQDKTAHICLLLYIRVFSRIGTQAIAQLDEIQIVDA